MVPEITLHGHRCGHFAGSVAGDGDPVAAPGAQGHQPKQAVRTDSPALSGNGDHGIGKLPGDPDDLLGRSGVDTGVDGMLESFHGGFLLLGLRCRRSLRRFHLDASLLETFPTLSNFKHTPCRRKNQVPFFQNFPTAFRPLPDLTVSSRENTGFSRIPPPTGAPSKKKQSAGGIHTALCSRLIIC